MILTGEQIGRFINAVSFIRDEALIIDDRTFESLNRLSNLLINELDDSEFEINDTVFSTVSQNHNVYQFEKEANNLEKPEHYNQGNQDLFGFIDDGLMTKDEAIGFYKGNIYKYLFRYQHKNGIEDLKKANVYLNKLIEVTEFNEKVKELTWEVE